MNKLSKLCTGNPNFSLAQNRLFGDSRDQCSKTRFKNMYSGKTKVRQKYMYINCSIYTLTHTSWLGATLSTKVY